MSRGRREEQSVYRSDRVVRRLACDLHVVRMRFPKTGARDAYELRFRSQFVDRRAADVAHSAAEPTDHLEEHVAHRTTIGHAPFDAFGNELLRRQLAFLEIAVGTSVLHRREAAHAAHHLEATA